MASADLRTELRCSVCLDIYKDPVNLKCGHNFCRACIDRVLDTQRRSGGFSCPECRKRFRSRPVLQRNFTLCNIVGNFLSAWPDQEESRILCTFCVDSPVPAVRSCLHCEVSLCDKHLRVHKTSPEHILTEPTLSMESRKCFIHREILKYYCTEDNTCICASCSLAGEHQGHQVEMLDEASEKKKNKLRNVLQKLQMKKEEMEKRVQNLKEHKRKVEVKAAGDTEVVTNLLRELKRRLIDLEMKVLNDISKKTQQFSISISKIIRNLEIKKNALSRRMHHIEELCDMTDPLKVLQESDTSDLCDTKDGHEDRHNDGGGLDVEGLSQMLHTGLSDMITEVNVSFYIHEADILLDVNTAGNELHISDDRRTASRTNISQNRQETPERFQYPQVISKQSCSSGRHYWEVDVGGSEKWRAGVCYPSIDRKGWQSVFGNKNKSWVLEKEADGYSVIHDGDDILLPTNISSNRVRIYVDYEAGRISFYDLCDPIRHLHTFTTTFTEPLHVGVCVWRGCINICGGNLSSVRTSKKQRKSQGEGHGIGEILS